MTKKYKNVASMVTDLSEDAAFSEGFSERLQRREFIKTLMVLRAREGMSQQELAQQIGCTQSKVSKLESSGDAEIRFGDLMSYLKAVKHKALVYLVPENQTRVDAVKMHAFEIRKHLACLVDLAGKDAKIAEGIDDFLQEANFNLTMIVKRARRELPASNAKKSALVEVETVEEGPDPELPINRKSRSVQPV